MKKLKKFTPDFEKAEFDNEGNRTKEQVGLKRKDTVDILNDTKCLVTGYDVFGRYFFDSFDAADGTIFISRTEMFSTSVNVKLSEVFRIETWRDTIPH